MSLPFLYESLHLRPRPEDVAERILTVLAGRLSRRERRTLEKAAGGSLRRVWNGYTSMLQSFGEAVGAGKQVTRTIELFELEHREIDATDPAAIEAFIAEVSPLLHKQVGANDFLGDRHNRAERRALGMDLSKRAYNKRWRMLKRLERKLQRFERERRRIEYQMIGKHGLSHTLSWEAFSQDVDSACFIAYYTARGNLRSVFTNGPQTRAFDEVSAVLLDRCRNRPTTNWWAIAHAYSGQEVLGYLPPARQGELLGKWTGVLEEIAGLLGELWDENEFNRETMIVRRGNDSTTWNNVAGAWNKSRDNWMNLLYALGMEQLLQEVCFGKVLRLMAADVVAWHRSGGGQLDPNTEVWNLLPLPWEVFRGEASCSRGMVVAACKLAGIDAERSGWIAPRPHAVVAFTPTPELVHGVAVGNPYLAQVLRRHKYFSGKAGGTPLVPEQN